jgi:hypothetical protein
MSLDKSKCGSSNNCLQFLKRSGVLFLGLHIYSWSNKIAKMWCHETQHSDTQHNDTQHNNKKHDIQCNGTWHSILLCWISFKMSVIYAECHKQTHYAECRYAECHYPERRGVKAEIRGFVESQFFSNFSVLWFLLKLNFN